MFDALNNIRSNQVAEAEEILLGYVRCPECEDLIESTDGASKTRIAACGHVFHKDPEPCWRNAIGRGARGEQPRCKACDKSITYRP